MCKFTSVVSIQKLMKRFLLILKYCLISLQESAQKQVFSTKASCVLCGGSENVINK